MYIPDKYKEQTSYTTDSIRYDWAVLKLDNNIGNQSGWLNLQNGGITIGEEGPDYYLSGYPVHDVLNENYKNFQTNFLDNHYKEYQFCAKGKITNANLRYMEHKIDMLRGQSGSPIYTFGDDGSIKVIAINAAGDLSYKMNYAKAITYEIINTAAAF